MTDETNDQQWTKKLDFTIIGVKMDVLCDANLKGGPPTPLLMTDFQKMTSEKLQEKDLISVVHYPEEPKEKPLFQRCINQQHILKIEGPMFGHSATTHGGSSGCPVFREYERRWIVVGLHRGELPVVEDGKRTVLTNLATRISAVYAVYKDEQHRPYNGPVPDMKEFAHGAHALIPESTSTSSGDDEILSKNVDETKGYLVLFRTHVSNNATGRGRALLEALELPPEEIAAVYDNFEKRESDSVQAGLLEWSGGRARSPSWEVLLAAMNKAGFAREHCEGLEGKLTDIAKKETAEPSDGRQILSTKVYSQPTKSQYPRLFRKYVSDNAAGKGRALLADLQLKAEKIADVYASTKKSEIEAVQKGLEKWREGRARDRTWKVLLDAMSEVDFPVEHCNALEEELKGMES